MRVDIQFSQHGLLKRLFFPHWIILVPWWSFDLIHEGLFLVCLLYSIGLYVCLYASTTLFWLLNLCRKFQIQEVWVLQFCSFFFRIFLATWGPMRLWWLFLCLQKHHLESDLDYMKYVDYSGWYWHLNIRSSNPWTQCKRQPLTLHLLVNSKQKNKQKTFAHLIGDSSYLFFIGKSSISIKLEHRLNS